MNLAIRLREADKTAHDALIVDLNKVCASHLFNESCEVDIQRTFSKANAVLNDDPFPQYEIEANDVYGLIAKTATKRYAIGQHDGIYTRGHYQAETLDGVMRGAV